MKKTLIIIGSVMVALAITAICFGIYVIQTPEYAMLNILRDVKASGIDGLRPHLTENAQETVDTISAISENKLVSSIAGLLGKRDYVSVLKSKMQQMQWNVAEVMKSRDHAAVIVAFNYDDQLIGTIEISMVHSQDGWKIDGLELPKFDVVNW